MTATDQQVSVRYIVDDVQAAVDFYTTHLGFTLNTCRRRPSQTCFEAPCGSCSPELASSGARATPDDVTDAGRNRVQLVMEDLDAEIARLRAADVSFRSDVVAGPGGRQILLADPAENLIELSSQPGTEPPSWANPAWQTRRARTQPCPSAAVRADLDC